MNLQQDKKNHLPIIGKRAYFFHDASDIEILRRVDRGDTGGH